MDKGKKEVFNFANNLATQLRGIVSEYNSASHRLLDQKLREADPVFDQRAAAVDKQYFTMMRLIENLEDMCHLDLEASLRVQDTDMVTLVGDVCQKAESALGNPARHVAFRCPMGTLLWAVNATTIERALYHLLSNGLKYSSEDIVVSLTKEKKQLVLSVTDTGCGMDAKTQANYLPPTEDAAFHIDVKNGLEMGLHFVQAIAIRHGGTMTIKSELGQGTTVTLRLPAVDKGNLSVGDVAQSIYVTKSGYNTTLAQLADALDVEAFRLSNQG